MTQWLRFTFVLGLLTLTSAMTASPQAQAEVGAACVIRHADKLVMVSELITGKLALPGGYIGDEKTAAEAAEREALEETGLSVTAGKRLASTDETATFNCVSESSILVSSTPSDSGFHMLAAWFAPHFGKEIKHAYLINPNDIRPEEYRFPEDYHLLKTWLDEAETSQVKYFSSLGDMASDLHQQELILIKQFQHAIFALPDTAQQAFKAMMALLNLPGEAVFIYLLLPLCFAYLGPKACLRLALMVLITSVLSSLLKDIIGWPRPFYLEPELQQATAKGFGMPSGHTMMATVLWGTVWYEWGKGKGRHLLLKTAPLALALIFGQAVARVWLGVHFITDTVAGFLLGCGVVYGLAVWQKRPKLSLDTCLVSKPFWLMACATVTVLSVMTQIPEHIYGVAITLGILFGLNLLPAVSVQLTSPQKVLTSLTGIIGLAAIVTGFELLAGLSSSSITVLATRMIGYSAIALWLVGGMSIISRALVKSQKATNQ